MSIVLGGPNAIRVFQRGPFGVSLERINDEPAICLWPHPARLGAGAFIVCLSAYHQYFELPTARPTPYAYEQVTEGLKVMGFEPTDTAARNLILDILYGWADDVVRLPPDLRPRELPRELEGFEIRDTESGKLIASH